MYRLFPFETRPVQLLAGYLGINTSPAWSPDGRQLALTLSKDGNPEIYVLTFATGSLRRLTTFSGIDTEPTWSPTGREIAFVSDRAGPAHIFVMDADGTNVRRLTNDGFNTQPRWSPKGDVIAYTSRQGNHDIWAVSTDGQGMRRLTAGPGSNESASWAPNGRHLDLPVQSPRRPRSSSRCSPTAPSSNSCRAAPARTQVLLGRRAFRDTMTEATRVVTMRADQQRSSACSERFKWRSKGGFNNMFHRRGNLFLVAPLLMLTLFLVGCPKRPATMTAGSGTAAPAPTPPPAAAVPAPSPSAVGAATPPPVAAAPATPAPAPTPNPSQGVPVTAAPARRPRVAAQADEFTANANLNQIHFDFDKYNIRPGDAKILDANAAWLKSNTGNLVLIEGHCDERGTAEYNLALGERRAKSTMNYLVAQGVQANRITIISYGKERPSAPRRRKRAGRRTAARTS